MLNRLPLSLLTACASLMVIGCSGGGGSAQSATVAPPPTPTITVAILDSNGVPYQTTGSFRCYTNGSPITFKALVSGTTNQSVTWQSTIGSIDANGIFYPGIKNGSGTIKAISVANPSSSFTLNVYIDIPTQQMQGAWNGTFRSDVVGQTYTVTALSNELGKIAIGNFNGLTITGNMSLTTANTLSGTGSMFASYNFPNGSKTGTFNCTGIIATKSNISGTYSGAGDRGTFSLTYDSTFDKHVTLNDIQGSWRSTLTTTGIPTNVSVYSDGSFTGNDYYGTLSGKIIIPKSNQNLFEISATYRSSYFPTASYNGFGYIVFDSTSYTRNQFRMVLSGSSGAFGGSFTR